MLPPDTLFLFFTASVLLALTPGPDNLFVLTLAARGGRAAGFAVTFGLCTGLLVHTSAVALGVAAVFQASALAFSLLKYAGAAYLLYLTFLSFRAQDTGVGRRSAESLGFRKLYLRGIIMNVTNPKVSLFFLAFLPQFTNPAVGPIVPQIFFLGFLFILSTILVFGLISLLAGTVGSWLQQSEKARTVLNYLAGVVFLGLAVKLVLVRR